MLLHEFGSVHEKTIVMIHGLVMSWEFMRAAIDLLAVDYRVIAVAVPGHDPDEANEFTSVEAIADQLGAALLQRGIDRAECLYGLSMGGGLAIRMLAVGPVHFRCAVIDAGITPYDLPYPLTRLILLKDFLLTEWGKHSRGILAAAFPPAGTLQFSARQPRPRPGAYPSTTSSTVYPASRTAWRKASPSAGCFRRRVAVLSPSSTVAHTPGRRLSAFSTRRAQLPQVMPSIRRVAL